MELHFFNFIGIQQICRVRLIKTNCVLFQWQIMNLCHRVISHNRNTNYNCAHTYLTPTDLHMSMPRVVANQQHEFNTNEKFQRLAQNHRVSVLVCWCDNDNYLQVLYSYATDHSEQHAPIDVRRYAFLRALNQRRVPIVNLQHFTTNKPKLHSRQYHMHIYTSSYT